MRKTETVTYKSQEVKVIVCNKCSIEYKPDDFEGLSDALALGGYFSKYLGDGNVYKFDICEKCLTEYFESFKIKPTVESIL